MTVEMIRYMQFRMIFLIGLLLMFLVPVRIMIMLPMAITCFILVPFALVCHASNTCPDILDLTSSFTGQHECR